MSDDLNEIRQDLAHLAGLPDALVRIEAKLGDVDDIVRAMQISIAKKETEQDVLIDRLKTDVTGIGTKISKHISEHWTFLLVVVGLVGAIMAVAEFIAK